MTASKTYNQTAATLAAALALLLVQGSNVHAATACNTAVQFNSNTSLSADYEVTTTNGTGCIVLNNGADLNLNGKKITCKSATAGGCQAAILATTTGSRVYNSVPANVAIDNTGVGWVYGVRNAEEVEDLRIDSAEYGISSTNATDIHGNVLTNVEVCIYADMPSSISVIEHNLCDHTIGGGSPTIGIDAVGQATSPAPLIRNNLILHSQMGIVGDLALRINDNIVCHEQAYGGLGVGVVIDAAQSQSGTHNLCCNDPEDTTNNACKQPDEHGGNFTAWP
jgi:hypothetical protein